MTRSDLTRHDKRIYSPTAVASVLFALIAPATKAADPATASQPSSDSPTTHDPSQWSADAQKNLRISQRYGQTLEVIRRDLVSLSDKYPTLGAIDKSSVIIDPLPYPGVTV